MHRRLSSIVKGKNPSSIYDDDSTNDSSSTIVKEEEELVAPVLKVKRVDHYYSRWYKNWRYRTTSSKVSVETVPVLQSGNNDPWKDCTFVIVRKMPQSNDTKHEPTFKIVVKSGYILKACKEVIKSWPGISWNSDPLELEPEIFVTFLDEFIKYRDGLTGKKSQSLLDGYMHSSVSLLINTIEADYQHTLTAIRKLKSHGEIKHDYLYALFVPRSIIVTQCAITGQPRLFYLKSVTRLYGEGYQLNCESWDLVDKATTQTVTVGKVSTTILMKPFKGTVKITSLDAYPIQYHADPEKLKADCLARGKKWLDLIGVHHKQFNGIAAVKNGDNLIRHTVKGRIMIDRAAHKRFNPNYKFPASIVENNVLTTEHAQPIHDPYNNLPPPPPPIPIQPANQYANGTVVQIQAVGNKDPFEKVEMDDDKLLLTSTVVLGFSLADKLWLEFDVTKVEDVEWNTEAFEHLVLPTNHKNLLQSLVEAHHAELGFDDFIRGKGQGLVINLFGPPGVGKTFSAEATSEHVRRPLYLVGAGDLGTSAAALDIALERVFEIATAWKAIVLIDEADVFLEQRSLHDLERNAMVAVFLRHIEYYRGILFLTTNRVKAFDEAFLSRIHVAMHFHELPVESRVQVWKAFIGKVGASDNVSPEELLILARRNINGRQIKNAVRTAQSLAVGRDEPLAFQHFVDTLDAMHDFTTEFESMQKRH